MLMKGHSLLLNTLDCVDNIEDSSDIYLIDRMLWQNGHEKFIGVDEAGRGPLAGPVVAAAVVLNSKNIIWGINDSKKLSKIKREELAETIKKKAIAVGIGIVDNKIIDKVNILNATLKSMKKAIKNLGVFSIFPVLVDGNKKIPEINNEQKTLVDGDARCASIAAASIIAKVTRDNIMHKYHKTYPVYGFDKHKGYGTKMHYRILAHLGPTPLHRLSFNLKKCGPS
ncbi:MAG: ribonuclease HII [Elusimicrobiota bacterium]